MVLENRKSAVGKRTRLAPIPQDWTRFDAYFEECRPRQSWLRGRGTRKDPDSQEYAWQEDGRQRARAEAKSEDYFGGCPTV